ncbi:hypothetical protein OG756_06685 [Streptomyces sp. NBC_01310]|nr:hypothetical protein OG756_06685 [Streptomyces sp. NBC_01310]
MKKTPTPVLDGAAHAAARAKRTPLPVAGAAVIMSVPVRRSGGQR